MGWKCIFLGVAQTWCQPNHCFPPEKLRQTLDDFGVPAAAVHSKSLFNRMSALGKTQGSAQKIKPLTGNILGYFTHIYL